VNIKGRHARRLGAVFLVAGVLGSITGIALGGDSISTDRPSIGGWPQDTDGDGVISDKGDERIPELIKAVGDDGTEGYVRYEDLNGPQPSSPEEAVKMSGVDRAIPLYAGDGVSVIGTYTLTSGGDPSGTADATAREAAKAEAAQAAG
jgi:hypothetical protein